MSQSTNNSSVLYGVGVGSTSTSIFAASPVVQTRDPTSSDIQGSEGIFPLGKVWVNSSSGAAYILSSFSPSSGVMLADWIPINAVASQVDQLDGDTGSATPTGGAITIAGTTNQIDTSASGSTVTLNIASPFVAPGAITAATGDITSNGNFIRGSAGSKDVYSSVATSATAGGNVAGYVALVAGTVIVYTTAITLNSLVRMTRLGPATTGANPVGELCLGVATVPGTYFTINSVDPADATSLVTTDESIVFWEIVN